jgi:hypothetical protein
MGEGERKKRFKEELSNAITRWKEVNTVMELKIIFVDSVTLVGEYKDNILIKPRALTVGQDPQGRGIIGMQLLVGDPESIEVIAPALMYDVKDEKVINLYIQSTTNIIPADEKTLKNLDDLRSIKPKLN